jgi:hypothetical protein
LHNGLCENCARSKEIRSDRGSLFILCTRGLTDPAWPKYPRLPVLRCTGFEARPLRIIFLDVDGVLAAPGFPGVEALNWLVAETGARLVVMGGGRVDYGELLRNRGVQGEVLAATGGVEIQTWLDEHRSAGPVQSFVILGDAMEQGTFSSRLIRIEAGTGLTREQATRAHAILQGTCTDDTCSDDSVL